MRTFTVGQIQGIDIRIHPTMGVVAIWALYRWGIAGGHGLSGMLYGVAFVSGLFTLVLLHELGHGLMAHQYGLKVRDISLLPFGGVARVEQMPSNARVESAVALAGSLTNLAVAVTLMPVLLLWMVFSGQSLGQLLQLHRFDTPSLQSLVLYLYLANLLLGLINLLPMFPMDGGRVLRSVLSELLGRMHATQLAVFISILASVVIGAFALASGELLLLVVCVMLIGFALAEGRAVRIEDHLRRMQVGQFAVWERGGIGPSEPLAIALRDGPRDVVVTAHGAVIGMLWKADLQRALESGGLQKRAGELMDRHIVTADAGESIYDVHSLMAENNQWSIPVTENGVYRGMFDGERFAHVHHMLRSRTPERRHLTAFTGSLSQAFRGLVR
ncbi:MAG: site-2 protease family protein [Thermomicrobiales bacterium]